MPVLSARTIQPAERPRTPPPPKEDSAWSICEELPPWASDAAKFASLNDGTTNLKAFWEAGLSRSDVKSMIHGPHKLFSESEGVLRLTQLGYKIAAVRLATEEAMRKN